MRISNFSRALMFRGLAAAAVCVPGLALAQEPVAEPPVAEKPATEAPAAEAPAADPEKKPATEVPAAEAPAAEAPAAEAPAAEAPAPNPEAKQAFDEVLGRWKTMLKDLRALKIRYQTSKPDEQIGLKEEWNRMLGAAKDLLPELHTKATAAYVASPNTDPQLTRFLVKLAADDVQTDQYELAFEVSKALIANNCDDKSVYDVAGVSAYALGEFDLADKYLQLATEAGTLSRIGQEFATDVKQQLELWNKEKEIRAAEAKADDLPRVKFETSAGTIVIELFENEAPDTVGNFISLVEKKFYDGLSFHRVLANFMAQGGDPSGDGTGGPGYEIFCECHQENYRRHFRGALSMAHAGRDTGGSQFFITFRPTGNLNGRHTCFGRVIEGMDVLAKITRRDPQGEPPLPTPDTIVKAEVVRKRDHAYAPKKVQ